MWHVIGFAVLSFAAMRQVRKLGGQELTWLLSFGLFLALPMALGAIRNGQATILLTGACWLLTLSALEGRRAETFFWASLAVIAKPTAIIMLLLAGALRPRLIPGAGAGACCSCSLYPTLSRQPVISTTSIVISPAC